MNVILFEEAEVGVPLPRTDPRAVHIETILKRAAGERFDAGIVDGAMGKGWIESADQDSLILGFAWTGQPPALSGLQAVIGLPRPQTARKVLQEATSLGLGRITFFQAERGEPSYASSTLWSDGEWRRILVNGASQAFDTRLPVVTHCASLARALAGLPMGTPVIALDNYEATGPLSLVAAAKMLPIVLALGAERGWSAAERDLLRARGAALAHLGARVLRVETALIAGIAVLQAGRSEM